MSFLSKNSSSCTIDDNLGLPPLSDGCECDYIRGSTLEESSARSLQISEIDNIPRIPKCFSEEFKRVPFGVDTLDNSGNQSEARSNPPIQHSSSAYGPSITVATP